MDEHITGESETAGSVQCHLIRRGKQNLDGSGGKGREGQEPKQRRRGKDRERTDTSTRKDLSEMLSGRFIMKMVALLVNKELSCVKALGKKCAEIWWNLFPTSLNTG